ncbi:MAG: pantoate--beta-alanine ligase [Proteobacteria bacterium]|nr:pantoate--beta-alanine ligase [Pseudomonadota bacterium]
MLIVKENKSLQKNILDLKKKGTTIGFVPTMGCLHKGHLSLINTARSMCDHLVVSIFVNPLQFGPNEDLDSYPRTPYQDQDLCSAAGVDTLFMPSSLYDEDHSTFLHVQHLGSGLCGAKRPGHFDGVVTVVARLFGFVQPDLAVFGEKDFQQLAIIRQMVKDLGLPINIIGGTLIRDEDGLALSSRNRYLSHIEKKRALSLSQALKHIQSKCYTSTQPLAVQDLLKEAKLLLDTDHLDYLSIVDPVNLEELETIDGPARALVAAKIGSTRLIDNVDVTWRGK